MRKFVYLVLLIALLAGGYRGYFFIKQKYFSKSKIQALQTAQVELSAIRELIVETGIIKPQVGAEVKIGARATGVITRLYVKIGDKVKKEQLIAQIDDREIQESIKQLKASLQLEQDKLRKLNLVEPKRIQEAREDVSSIRATFDLAAQELERQSELLKKGFTTKSELDRAESDYKKSFALLKRAEKITNRMEEEFLREQEVIERQIKVAQATIEKEMVKLSYTMIYSPIDGIVSDVTAEEGETLVTGLQVANLVTIIAPEKLEMWVYIDETDIGRVKEGMAVEYTVDTYADKTFKGIINRIRPQPEIKAEIVYYLGIVEMSLSDAAFLRPEMTTYVKIIISHKDNVLAVPNGALKYEEKKQIVYQVVGGEIIKKTVEVGIRGEYLTEIVSGLDEGASVATKLLIPPK
jgi:multidrug resistance efflux pump